jgi:hypothetical protein
VALAVNLSTPASDLRDYTLEEDLAEISGTRPGYVLTRQDVDTIVKEDLQKMGAKKMQNMRPKSETTQLAAGKSASTKYHKKQSTKKKPEVTVAAAKPSITSIAAETGMKAVKAEAHATKKAAKTQLKTTQEKLPQSDQKTAKLEKRLKAEEARMTSLKAKEAQERKNNVVVMKQLAQLKAQVQAMQKSHAAPKKSNLQQKVKPFGTIFRDGHDYSHDADMDAIFGSSSTEQLDPVNNQPQWHQALAQESEEALPDIPEKGAKLHDISNVNVKQTLAHLPHLPGIPKAHAPKLSLEENDEKGLISELTDAHELRMSLHDHKLSPVAKMLQSTLSELKSDGNDVGHSEDLDTIYPKESLALPTTSQLGNVVKSQLLQEASAA